MYNKPEDTIRMCNVGEVFYKLLKDRVAKIQIVEVTHHALGHYVYRDDLGGSFFGRSFDQRVFRTEEEAELALKKKDLVKQKKALLQEYERQLNDEMGITDHFIIK